jgi:hypothetical protein
MSIAVLKKKTQTLYNNMSVGQKQFSINGTTRNQGYIGQTSLSRPVIHTPHKNNVPRGHGGCCGTFVNNNIKASETFSLEDNAVVKKSTMSNRGLLATKYRWINRPYPNAVVKAEAGRITNDQTDYINRLKKKTLTDIASFCPPPEAGKNVGKRVCSSSALVKTAAGFPIFSKPKLNCDVAKDLETVPYTKYILSLHDKCALNDNYKFVSPMQRTPFVGNN